MVVCGFTTTSNLCIKCGQSYGVGTVHHCPSTPNGYPPGQPVSIPSIWGATPAPQPSLARVRLERQIAALEDLESESLTDGGKNVLHAVLACLRDLAEDL